MPLATRRASKMAGIRKGPLMAFSLKSLFLPDPQLSGVRHLYGAIVEQARSSVFYQHLGVPDTATGRYAMVALHAFLVMDRLGRVAGQGKVSQALFDVMFADMDRNLREMGVGDLSVGKRVKALAGHFYAMAAAYRDGLNRGDTVLCAALGDYIYGNETPPPVALTTMAAYLRACISNLEEQAEDDISQGRIRFPEPRPGSDL
jgi:cytochrome b pre-mRNA-processing protein 3